MNNNDIEFIERTGELVPLIQRLHSTTAIAVRTQREKGSDAELRITDDELKCVNQALEIIKNVRERAYKQI